MDLSKYSISNNTVKRIYSLLNLKQEKSDRPSAKYYTPYEAVLPNTIWHVDIHFLYGAQHLPVYGIIDDKSRFLIALKLLPSKSSKETVKVAQEAISQHGKPFCFWSDNGGENNGLFTLWLSRNYIEIRHTLPHMPRQNGKIERLWPTLERNIPHSDNHQNIQKLLDEFKNLYNSIPHKTLPSNGFRPMTPQEVYTSIPKWNRTKKAEWLVTRNGHQTKQEIPSH
ncbi:hypothetical protein TVAGG3_0696070 [Trichomonas vaginalis G3]|uniref:hypothetical protein n=1 Tax=Trichomonas vaginalis (strain ATCC PRA-98 / G3) TaxID=412133 RepID=UPI0021E58123|nr:hypothetical protein TVAGG3_0696070 [Trichomonas vaginalis G3]KAI5508922.1 hypothetical protein TVAGG3_0696070 [Trichomonas vaginalis G3]